MSNRETFTKTLTDALDERDDLALVYAEISGQYFGDAHLAHPDRVINVGIREQLLIGTAAGLALTGIRPVAHTFSPFLVERAFEQVKLDLAHQEMGAVLVGSGGSFDMAALGRTHQSPGDVTLMSTLPAVTIHAPSTADETAVTLRRTLVGGGLDYVRISDRENTASRPCDGTIGTVREADGPLAILALGATLDAALEVGEHVGARVLSTVTVHPLDTASLREAIGDATEIVVIEPWLEGTSLTPVASALSDLPRRYLAIGTSGTELRRYGSPAQHEAAHGLTPWRILDRLRSWSSLTRDQHRNTMIP